MEKQVDGVPDGYELVAVRRAKNGDFFIDPGGCAEKWVLNNQSENVYPILRKVKTYREPTVADIGSRVEVRDKENAAWEGEVDDILVSILGGNFILADSMEMEFDPASSESVILSKWNYARIECDA